MAFDVLSQFGRRGSDATFRQFIDNQLVTFDTSLPPSPVHALAKPLKEDVQQVTERHQRLQPARIQQRTMKQNIQFDPCLQIASRPELLDELPQSRLNRRILFHSSHDMRQHSGFKNHAAVDELLRIGLQQAAMKAQMLREPLHVNASDGQPDTGLRFDNAEKLQRLGGFAKTESTDAERLGQLSFRGQPITWRQLLFNDISLDLTSHLIAANEFTISLETWNSLTADQQATMQGCADRFEAALDAITLEQEARLRGEFEAQGIVVYEPDNAAFRAHVFEVYRNSPYSANWPEGLLEAISAL